MYLLPWLRSLDGYLVDQAGSVVSTVMTLVILVYLIVLRCTRSRAWIPTLCDYGVLVFTATQIVSMHFGIYHENSLIYGARVATAANIYFIIRSAGGVDSKLFRVLTICACIMGLGLAIVNIPATIERFGEWKQLSLHNILPFRANFYLVGGGTKTDSLNLTLALLPFSLIALTREHNRLVRAVAILSAIGSCSVILMGMSRGVYLGYLSLCITILTVASARRIKLDRGSRILLQASAISVLLTICCYIVISEQWGGENKGTMTSEDRSISGRLHIWDSTLSNMRDYEILGVGGKNGALFTLEHIVAKPYQPFTARTFNWILEILLQNGVLGLVAFCAIIVSSTISLWHVIGSVDYNSQLRQIAVLVQGTIIAILVSDMTYTSVVRYPPIMCLFFVFAGAVSKRPIANSTQRHLNAMGVAISYRTVVLAVLVGFCFSFWGIRRSYSELEYSRASVALQQDDYNAASGYLAIAEKYSKCDALYASMNGLVLVRSVNNSAKFSELWQRGYVLSQKNRGRIEGALQAYQRASTCAPMDAEIHNNLAWLYVMLGDEKHAREQIDEAIRIEPYTSLYHISSGMFYEKDGRLDAAYDEYSTAIAYSPSILDSKFYSQFNKRHADKSSRIIESSKSDLSRFPNTPMRMAALAKLLLLENNYTSVKLILTDVLNKLPNLSYPWYSLGEIAESEGNVHEAVLDYRRALFIDPMNRAILARLANIDNTMGKDYEGLRSAQIALMVETPSEHAMRSERMYSIDPLSPDDIVPTGLLNNIDPQINVDSLCVIIYQISGRHGLEIPSDVAAKIQTLGGTC